MSLVKRDITSTLATPLSEQAEPEESRESGLSETGSAESDAGDSSEPNGTEGGEEGDGSSSATVSLDYETTSEQPEVAATSTTLAPAAGPLTSIVRANRDSSGSPSTSQAAANHRLTSAISEPFTSAPVAATTTPTSRTFATLQPLNRRTFQQAASLIDQQPAGGGGAPFNLNMGADRLLIKPHHMKPETMRQLESAAAVATREQITATESINHELINNNASRQQVGGEERRQESLLYPDASSNMQDNLYSSQQDLYQLQLQLQSQQQSICYTPVALLMVILVTMLVTIAVCLCAHLLIRHLGRHQFGEYISSQFR